MQDIFSVIEDVSKIRREPLRCRFVRIGEKPTEETEEFYVTTILTVEFVSQVLPSVRFWVVYPTQYFVE